MEKINYKKAILNLKNDEMIVFQIDDSVIKDGIERFAEAIRKNIKNKDFLDKILIVNKNVDIKLLSDTAVRRLYERFSEEIKKRGLQ